ncbi:TPA: hypothetical protein N0F65_003380 [Lagenidium giganteum]|uniref:Uncharacterized protein n=1 Tax=Lagenidium giganteum TaxID=4803 RepID=A0AAV2Z6W8_9STRA|nr:TPA: hypothetical protein N0F65_003380 [Lagenidium giganteum]
MTTHFPRQPFIMSGHWTHVVRERHNKLRKFLSTLHVFVLDRANHSCGTIADGVAGALHEFIHGKQVLTTAPTLRTSELSPVNQQRMDDDCSESKSSCGAC